MQSSIRTICVVVVSVFLCATLREIAVFFRSLQTSLHSIDATLQSVEQAAANASAASQTAKEAALEQKKYWAMTSLQTYKVITDLKGLIVRTDRSVNVELTPRLAGALDSTNQLGREAAGAIRQTTDNLQPAIADLTRASASLADAMADPAIRSTLVHVDETSSHVAAATGNLAATTDDLKQVADKFRETYTKPGSTLWATLKGLIHLVFETRGALAK